MKQVRSALEQAVECGVARVDLHPSNILLRVGKNGPTMAREAERLMQKRLDAWPPFRVKIRPHMTMRSLYEPLLVEFDSENAESEEHLRDRDYRHRSFVVLATYLLAGERQLGGQLQFSESVPETTASYVRQTWELAQTSGKAPSPMEFIDRFEATLSAPVIDLATRLRGDAVPVEQMESAGAVSDFEEEWSSASADEESSSMVSPKHTEFCPHGGQKEGLPWGVWAAAAVVVLSLGAWFLLDKAPSTSTNAATSTSASKTEGPAQQVAEKPVVAVAKPTLPASESKPVAKPAPATEPAVATVTPQPAPAPVPAPAKPTLAVVATAPQTPPVPPEKPATQVPVPAVKPEAPKQAEKDPVTIRKALLPTREELEKMKQGHVLRKVGVLPEVNTASPLPPVRP
jgi:hypothetical protein